LNNINFFILKKEKETKKANIIFININLKYSFLIN